MSTMIVGPNIGRLVETAMEVMLTSRREAREEPWMIAEPATAAVEPATVEPATVEPATVMAEPATATVEPATVTATVEPTTVEPAAVKPATAMAAVEPATVTAEPVMAKRKRREFEADLQPQSFPWQQIVAIRLVPDDDKKVTLPATSDAEGQIIWGPVARLSGLLGRAAFVEQLNTRWIYFNRFSLGFGRGGAQRGSLVLSRVSTYECGVCGKTWRLSPVQRRLLLKQQRRREFETPVCQLCDKELRERGIPPPQIGVDDEHVERLWQAFSAYADDAQVPETIRGLVPRVWGVYPSGRNPGPWQPGANDGIARMIQKRVSQRGSYVIRPFAVAWQSGMKPNSLLIESTLDFKGEPGWAVGWMTPEMLGGLLGESPEYGWRVNLSHMAGGIAAV